MEGLVSSRGGTAPYRPLCSVLYRGGGRLCTVPCVWFYTGGTALYRPLSSILYITVGTALYRPLCLVLYRI